MATHAHTPGAPSRALSFLKSAELEDASAILDSIDGTLDMLVGYLEEYASQVGTGCVQTVYLITTGVGVVKAKVNAAVTNTLAAKNALEGC